MSESPTDLAKRGIELFNRDMGAGKPEPSPDARATWAPEPVIVPLRAKLEGTEFRGPTALDDFWAASLESWSRAWLEPAELRELDSERVLMLGDLVTVARETGLEIRASIAMLFVLRDGLLAENRTFTSEREALEAVT